MSEQKSFSNEQIRMALSLAFLVLAAPAVIPSGQTHGFAFYVGWILIGASIVLALWSRLKPVFKL